MVRLDVDLDGLAVEFVENLADDHLGHRYALASQHRPIVFRVKYKMIEQLIHLLLENLGLTRLISGHGSNLQVGWRVIVPINNGNLYLETTVKNQGQKK